MCILIVPVCAFVCVRARACVCVCVCVVTVPRQRYVSGSNNFLTVPPVTSTLTGSPTSKKLEMRQGAKRHFDFSSGVCFLFVCLFN